MKAYDLAKVFSSTTTHSYEHDAKSVKGLRQQNYNHYTTNSI